MKTSSGQTREEALKLVSKSAIYGNLGLFVGTGMSMAVLNSEWDTIALSWKELIYKCAEEFKIKLNEEIVTEGLSYPEIATEVAKIISKKEKVDYITATKKLKEKIAELTSWYPENKDRILYGKILEEINPSWIITTNYDLIIECLLTGKCLSLGPNDQLISPQGLIPVYHLHGIRTNPDSIIISQEDYISLFRPNQYRQQKLSLSIKESTTLIIGYGLGDVNVLTAVDWTKNVYSNQRINYPQDIIQLLFTVNPKNKPYRDWNDILIIEFNNLYSVLNEIRDLILTERQLDLDEVAKLNDLNEILKNPEESHVTAFIDDKEFRDSVIDTISENNEKLISGFLELFSKCMDETWNRAKPNGAFEAYNQNLIILLDILEKIELLKIPPALFESIAYNFDRVSRYIGTSLGESRSAYGTLNRRKDKIPLNALGELKNIAKSRGYTSLHRLLRSE